MSERKKMTRAEYFAEGERRFGTDHMQWKFKCPICETSIKVTDYVRAGAKETQIAFNCIGRFLPKDQVQRAFGDEKRVVGNPCDYTGGGLFNFNPIELEDGSTWFDFSDEN